ncbi:hypothetical protein BDB00DRAFT_872838 [Zychaea mexicana]|uniref:uncharacterized protein n=1 Tax=Zychaea mexicana TaxID=64656 RepID=UPI0022FF2A7F|nr:uncharacterized protein BDB00DRAFT_872838 [Zychaea mexicana]KAI9492979.1 hypothetical protein BDB00DRAFT_872838 [Zychaea mexicana]
MSKTSPVTFCEEKLHFPNGSYTVVVAAEFDADGKTRRIGKKCDFNGGAIRPAGDQCRVLHEGCRSYGTYIGKHLSQEKKAVLLELPRDNPALKLSELKNGTNEKTGKVTMAGAEFDLLLGSLDRCGYHLEIAKETAKKADFHELEDATLSARVSPNLALSYPIEHAKSATASSTTTSATTITTTHFLAPEQQQNLSLTKK